MAKSWKNKVHIQPLSGQRWMHRQIEMLFLLAKPESGADCLRCRAGRLSFQSQGERCSRTVAQWAPGGCAANGPDRPQHAPSSAKQKGKRRISPLKMQFRMNSFTSLIWVLMRCRLHLMLCYYCKCSPHPLLLI